MSVLPSAVLEAVTSKNKRVQEHFADLQSSYFEWRRGQGLVGAWRNLVHCRACIDAVRTWRAARRLWQMWTKPLVSSTFPTT